jgi:hypothetical protein
VGATGRVEWEFRSSPSECLRVLKEALRHMDATIVDEGPLHLQARTPLSVSKNVRGGDWIIELAATEEGAHGVIALEMAGTRHKALLNELAARAAPIITRKDEVPTAWQAAKAEVDTRRREKEEKTRQRAIEKQEEREAELQRLRESQTIAAKDSIFVEWDGARDITIRRGLGLLKQETHAIDPSLKVDVETAGNLAARPTLTRTATGLVLAGPLGALLGATAWKETGDVFLVFESDDWAELVPLKPKQFEAAKKLQRGVDTPRPPG